MPFPLRCLKAFFGEIPSISKHSRVDRHLTRVFTVTIDTIAALHNNRDNTQSHRAEKTYG
jgi:hypothetical protein